MKNLSDINIEKSRSGVYKDNEENRRLHRVGQRYGQPKKEESSKGASSLPTKRDLEFSKDGSSIVVENVQTGNTVIFYSKRGGKWFSNHAMMTGGIETNPERMFRTLQGYNKKPYSIKPDLNVEESASDIQDLKRDKKEAEDALKKLRQKESLYVSYQGGDEKYNRAVQSLKNKIDTLGQEITRRNTEDKKKPSQVNIEGKTFRVEDGKIAASIYDTYSRLSKLKRFAMRHDYQIKWESGSSDGAGYQRPGEQSTRSAERAGQIMRESKATEEKGRIEYGKKTLSSFLKDMGLEVTEKAIGHNLRSDGADGLHYVSGGHVPVRASYYPSENKLVFSYPNVRSQFAGDPTDQKFKDVVKAIIDDRNENNPVEGLDKLSIKELKSKILRTEQDIRNHNFLREAFEKYQVGDAKERADRWGDIKERLERKRRGLLDEDARRFKAKYGINIGVKANEGGTNKKANEVQNEGKFSRVNLADIPNAHKVNLKKYLSAKRKKAVDDAWDKAKFDSVSRENSGVFQEGYNKLREQFNNNFDDMSKSERAELLYKILKMKNAMEKKQ